MSSNAAATRAEGDDRSLVLQKLNEDRAVGDDALAGFEPRRYLVVTSRTVTERHAPARKAAVVLNDIDEGQVLVVAQDRRGRHRETLALSTIFDPYAHIHLLLEEIARVVYGHP